MALELTRSYSGFQSRDGETSEYTFVLYCTCASVARERDPEAHALACLLAYDHHVVVNDDYQGGNTQFCDVEQWGVGQVRQIEARKGSVLVFRQRDMKHRGATIVHGSKYIIQGMVMYGPLRFNALGKPIGKAPMEFTPAVCACE